MRWRAPARLHVLLVVFVLIAVTMAGCFASGGASEGKTLKEYKRASPEGTRDEFRFSVAEGTEEIQLHFSTEAPKKDEPSWNFCFEDNQPSPCDDDDDVTGYMRAEIRSPDDQAVDEVTLTFGAKDTTTLADPMPGMWLVRLNFVDGYDGPTDIRITDTSGGTVLFGGSFWDVTGVVLTVLTGTVGFLLYRRRTSFLGRELNRIDNTYRSLGDDIDECRDNLVELREHLKDLLVRRKIPENHFLILEKRIEQYLQDLVTPGNRHAENGATMAPRGASMRRVSAPDPDRAWEEVAIDPDLDDTDKWVRL